MQLQGRPAHHGRRYLRHGVRERGASSRAAPSVANARARLTPPLVSPRAQLVPQHKIMCPPNVYGTVVKLYGEGTDGHDSFGVEDTVLEVR